MTWREQLAELRRLLIAEREMVLEFMAGRLVGGWPAWSMLNRPWGREARRELARITRDLDLLDQVEAVAERIESEPPKRERRPWH